MTTSHKIRRERDPLRGLRWESLGVFVVFKTATPEDADATAEAHNKSAMLAYKRGLRAGRKGK